MYSPKPYGLLVRGAEPTGHDLAFVDNKVKHLIDFIQASGLTSVKRQYELPDGGWCLVQDMGGVIRAITVKAKEDEKELRRGVAHTLIPMFFSGYINNGMPNTQEGKGVDIKITKGTQHRLAGYDQNVTTPSDLKLVRFNVDYHQDFKIFKPKYTGIYDTTQYLKLRPSWYSGAMAGVVQIVAGYGSQDFENLPDDKYERASIKLPLEYKGDIVEAQDEMRLPACDGIPDKLGQIRYDFRFLKTHGVHIAADGLPWLVEISSNGLWVMPLPLIPATITKTFKKFVIENGDIELLNILEKFGGMPSGELFPKDRESWQRAGVCLKISDASDFYSCQPYYDLCGWSFNDKGTEAVNTAWIKAGDGCKVGRMYAMQLAIGETEDGGNVGQVTVPDDHAEIVGPYMVAFMKLLNNTDDRDIAIRYKMRRVPQDVIYDRAKYQQYGLATLGPAEVDYWDKYECKPIASAVGGIVKTFEQRMYQPFSEQMVPEGRLKFPNWDATGTESFVIGDKDYEGSWFRTDAIVHAYYADNQLKVLKYFYNERKFTSITKSDFEDIMQVGSWSETTTSGTSGLMGNFYTTDYDDRQAAAPIETVTTIQGSDLGYGAEVICCPDLLYTSECSVSRSRYYKHVLQRTTTQGFGLDCAVCVPLYTRDAALYVYDDYISDETYYEEHYMRGVMDPWTYGGWTYDPAFYFRGRIGKGDPVPDLGQYVYIDKHSYTPSRENSFADNGNWYGVTGDGDRKGSGNYKDVSHILNRFTDRYTGTHPIGGACVSIGTNPYVEPYKISTAKGARSSHKTMMSHSKFAPDRIHRNPTDINYYRFFPVQVGNSLVYFYRDSCRNCFGEADYSSTDEGTNASGVRTYRGKIDMVDNKRAYYFIGVINE